MASVDEMREQISANRQKLHAALASAGEKWESGDDEGWTPRMAAQHCIDRDFSLAGIAAAGRRGEPPAPEHATESDRDPAVTLPLPTAADAVSALERSGAASDAALADLTAADLATEAELNVGDALPNTIEGVMALAAWHLNDHAEQIAKMG